MIASTLLAAALYVAATEPSVLFERTQIVLVPTLRVGMQKTTLCVAG